MASIKSFLLEYFSQRHFDLMSPEVRARFDEYTKTSDFTGNMKWWKSELVSGHVPDISVLSDDQIKELYMVFQNVLQHMYDDKSSFKHDDVLTKFITKWFGDEYKTFNNTQATPALETAIANLKNTLITGRTSGLPQVLTTNLSSVFTDFTYDDLIKGLNEKKYNTDLKFRDKFISVAEYVDYYSSIGDQTYWPTALPRVLFASDPAVGPQTDWFKVQNETDKINRFKTDYVELLDKLLTSKKIRDSFSEYGPGNTVSKQLNNAIKSTDYENKESDDFVPAKIPDSKNLLQRINDWKNDTFENYLRKFTNPTHGSRIYFSPWSQDISKALDKAEVKPTDGLAGIVDKKDKILEKLANSPTATKHFKWFTDTLSYLKSNMPKAYEGALKNGKQMQDLVSELIIKAVNDNKIKEAKTALEILSVSKYGFTTSKTVDALQKADFSIFGDKDLSWNKNEGVKFVTNAIDKTAKFALVGAGRVIAGARNLYQHSRTKINNDISGNKVLNSAYKQWHAEDDKAYNTAINENTAHNVDGRLNDLSSGHGAAGSGAIITTATVDAEQVRCNAMAAGPVKDALQADIDDFRDAIERKTLVDEWRSKNPDKFNELIAYWNMLESYTKSHSFTLGSMKIKRQEMLKDWGNNSLAEQIAKQEIANSTLTYTP